MYFIERNNTTQRTICLEIHETKENNTNYKTIHPKIIEPFSRSESLLPPITYTYCLNFSDDFFLMYRFYLPFENFFTNIEEIVSF